MAEKSVDIDLPLVFKQNCDIFERWCYEAPSGAIVQLPDRDELLSKSKCYNSEFSVVDAPTFDSPTLYNIEKGEVLASAKALIERGLNPAVLSFANGYFPCGLYEDGAETREEHLCRATTLSVSLNHMSHQVPSAYPMDMNFGGIYSDVLVFREGVEGGYKLLKEPWKLSVISVAALNLRSTYHHKRIVQNIQYAVHGEASMTAEGKVIMLNKIRTIFRIAVENGHDSVILGAWGCGNYKQRPRLIAQMFRKVLDENEFRRKFKEVHSVIEDHKQYVQYVRGIEGNARFKCDDRPAYFCFRVGDDRIWGAEYPGDSLEKVAREKLQHALDFGITHFIDLTEEGELPPYRHLLPDDGSVSYLRFPIRDARAPQSEEDVSRLLSYIEEVLQDPNTKIYLHCWGGVGRTGTISACWLARKYGFSYVYVMSELQKLWQTCLKSYSQPIPDHWSQKEFIKKYIVHLWHQRMISVVRQLFAQVLVDERAQSPHLDNAALIANTYSHLYEQYVEGGYSTLWSLPNHSTQELHFVQKFIQNESDTKSLLADLLC